MQRAIKRGGDDRDSYIVRKIAKVVCYVIQRFQEDIPRVFLAAVSLDIFQLFFPGYVHVSIIFYYVLYFIIRSIIFYYLIDNCV